VLLEGMISSLELAVVGGVTVLLLEGTIVASTKAKPLGPSHSRPLL